jgi:hypothetical protein
MVADARRTKNELKINKPVAFTRGDQTNLFIKKFSLFMAIKNYRVSDKNELFVYALLRS